MINAQKQNQVVIAISTLISYWVSFIPLVVDGIKVARALYSSSTISNSGLDKIDTPNLILVPMLITLIVRLMIAVTNLMVLGANYGWTSSDFNNGAVDLACSVGVWCALTALCYAFVFFSGYYYVLDLLSALVPVGIVFLGLNWYEFFNVWVDPKATSAGVIKVSS